MIIENPVCNTYECLPRHLCAWVLSPGLDLCFLLERVINAKPFVPPKKKSGQIAGTGVTYLITSLSDTQPTLCVDVFFTPSI